MRELLPLTWKACLVVLCVMAIGSGCQSEADNAAAGRNEAAAKTTTVSFNITGMTCEGCVLAIEQTVASVTGVESCVVDLEAEQATVVHGSDITEAQIIETITGIGGGQYGAEPIGP